MPYKNIEQKKEYHREYVKEYNKTHPLTPEQKKKKLEYMKAWNARNKDRVKVLSHKSYLKNKDKVLLASKKYREENSDKYKLRNKEYYLSNKDYFLEKSKEYYAKNKDILREYKKEYAKTGNNRFNSYKKSAKERGYEFNLTKEDFIKLFNGNCHYCNQENCRGVDRKHNEFGYSPENCLSCCKVCNYMKRDLSYIDFLKKIKEIYLNTY